MVRFNGVTIRGIRAFVSSHAVVASILDEKITDVFDRSVFISTIHDSLSQMDWFYISGVSV